MGAVEDVGAGHGVTGNTEGRGKSRHVAVQWRGSTASSLAAAAAAHSALDDGDDNGGGDGSAALRSGGQLRLQPVLRCERGAPRYQSE